MRAIRGGPLLISMLALALVAAGAMPGRPALAAAPPPAPRSGQIRIVEPGYTLLGDPASGVVEVATRRGQAYTSFPLAAVIGADATPDGTRIELRRTGEGLTADMVAADGTTLQRAQLTARATSFTVTFTGRAGPDLDLSPRFFFDGRRGLDLMTISRGFSPSNPSAPASLPAVITGSRTPLAPPPLDLELQTPPGWLGVGLVQIPDATSMRLLLNGALSVDYPLNLLTTFPDQGAGGRVGNWVRFPTFVFTFAANPLAGLSAYNQALEKLGHAPARAAPRPLWWQQPILDTWGAQQVDGAARGSSRFTAGWVAEFARSSQQRLGTRNLTLVIDSRWQEQIGGPAPDAVRFGSWDGMRSLIDSLHADGFKVLLWWPLWAKRIGDPPKEVAAPQHLAPSNVVDPTAADFEASTRQTIQRLLGSGPGDLHADGLKLDWTYQIPGQVHDPSRGWGAAALYSYLAALHRDAHQVQRDALIETSAGAPQFAGVSDVVRLYDAWNERDWQMRAAVVSAANPTVLIDGDGWDVPPASALTHAVSSAVYGVPALYFDDGWTDGSMMTPATAAQLGLVMSLATLKGSGSPRRMANGEWEWVSLGTVRARTFAARRGLIVWPDGCYDQPAATMVTTRTGTLRLPLTSRPFPGLVTEGGHPIKLIVRQGRVFAPLVAGHRYQVAAPCQP